VESSVGYDSIGKLNFWIPKLESPMSEDPKAFDVDQWEDVEHAVYHALVESKPFPPGSQNLPLPSEFEHRVAKYIAELVGHLAKSQTLIDREINQFNRNCRQ
jgi:hypothetical protein